MPDITPDNPLNQPGIFGNMTFITLKILSNSITYEMNRLVRAVLCPEPLLMLEFQNMTEYQINNCVYRVPPPTLWLVLLAWVRHAFGK
jgi:hypothetical protein